MRMYNNSHGNGTENDLSECEMLFRLIVFLHVSSFVAIRADSGSVGHGSLVKWVNNFFFFLFFHA